MERSGLVAPIERSDFDTNIFGLGLGVFNENIKILLSSKTPVSINSYSGRSLSRRAFSCRNCWYGNLSCGYL
jgi:hypothetical protein